MSAVLDYFLNKTVGTDFLESLSKTELWKPGTKTVLSLEEIRVGLKVVPRIIMSFLVKELASMEIKDNKEIQLPLPGAELHVTKLERDVYSGNILQDNVIIVDFKFRSIPGIGLVIMSAFELYKQEELEEKESSPENEHKIQSLIDERLALHALVEKVIEKKLSEKEAIEKMIANKLTSALNDVPVYQPEFITPAIPMDISKPVELSQEHILKGSSKLQKFLDTRKAKIKPKEFKVQLAKGEHVHCPDCGQSIFDGNTTFSGCVCLVDSDKVYIKKTEDGIKVRFGRSWEIENIEMLLKVLRG